MNEFQLIKTLARESDEFSMRADKHHRFVDNQEIDVSGWIDHKNPLSLIHTPTLKNSFNVKTSEKLSENFQLKIGSCPTSKLKRSKNAIIQTKPASYKVSNLSLNATENPIIKKNSNQLRLPRIQKNTLANFYISKKRHIPRLENKSMFVEVGELLRLLQPETSNSITSKIVSKLKSRQDLTHSFSLYG